MNATALGTETTRGNSEIEATVGVRRAFVEGVRELAPMALGIAPFGLAIGAAISASEIPTLVGWLGGPLIFAGAAQLATIEMLDGGAAPLMVIMSALVINTRILMYSTAMAPWFREESLGRRLLLAIPLIDQMFLVSAPRFEKGDLDRRSRQTFWFGGALLLGGTWVVSQTVAIVAGAQLHEGAGLQLAALLALAGLLAKSVQGRPAAVAAAVAGFVAVAALGLPFQSSVLVATLVGVTAGMAIAARTPNEVMS